jgi:hypothetical protein
MQSVAYYKRKDKKRKTRQAIKITALTSKQRRQYHARLLAKQIGRYELEPEEIANLIMAAMHKHEKATGKKARMAI